MKNFSIKILAMALACVLALLSITACGSGTGTSSSSSKTSSAAAKKTKLVLANLQDPQSLDPWASGTTASSRVINQVVEGLIAVYNDGTIHNVLAESYSWENETTLLFKLRKGVKFHDGSDFNADDVLWTFQKTKTSVKGAQLTNVDFDNVKKVDDYTVRVPLKEKQGTILYLLTSNLLPMASQVAYEKDPQALCGTGPYKFVKRVTGDRSELIANDAYWGGAPAIKEVVIRTITEAAQRTIELETGGVDIVLDVNGSDRTRIKANTKLQLETYPSFLNNVIVFNCRKEHSPLDNAQVRQAIAYGIDKAAIVKTAYSGIGKVAVGPLSTAYKGFDQDLVTTPRYEYNVEKAKKMLADLGYANGFNVTLIVDENAFRVATVEILQHYLSAMNIKVTLKSYESATYFDAVYGGKDWDISLIGTRIGSEGSLLLWTLSDPTGKSGYNHSGWYDEKYRQLVTTARNTTNETEYLSTLKQAQEIFMDNLPWLPVQENEEVNAANASIKGLKEFLVSSWLVKTLSFA